MPLRPIVGGALLLTSLGACNVLTGATDLSADSDPRRPSVIDSQQVPGVTNSDTTPGTNGSTPATGGHDVGNGTTDSTNPDAATPNVDGGGGGGNIPDAAPANPAPTTFLDPFTRADSPTIGNSWLEKTDRFAISNNAVVQNATGSYLDNIVMRPASEDALDVEISVDVVNSASKGDPCLFARIQATPSGVGQLRSYTFYYLDDAVFLDRDNGTTVTNLVKVSISPPLALNTPMHMWLKVTGTNPVVIEGVVKTQAGGMVTSIVTQDTSQSRITTAGGVGFGSGDALGARFDNFGRAP